MKQNELQLLLEQSQGVVPQGFPFGESYGVIGKQSSASKLSFVLVTTSTNSIVELLQE